MKFYSLSSCPAPSDCRQIKSMIYACKSRNKSNSPRIDFMCSWKCLLKKTYESKLHLLKGTQLNLDNWIARKEEA